MVRIWEDDHGYVSVRRVSSYQMLTDDAWWESLDDAQAKEISDVLTKVPPSHTSSHCSHPNTLTTQTFRGRLVEVIDQAQHFAALGPSGGGGPTGDSAQAFREGLDGTERECE
jgi:GINS complex subunit 3